MEDPNVHIITEKNSIVLNEFTIAVDLDGTAFVFRQMNEEYKDANGITKHFHMEDLYDEGYFANLPPQQNVCDAVKQLEKEGFHVIILSAYLPDSEYAAKEKAESVRKHISATMPVYLVPCGHKKCDFILDNGTPVLILDDYSKNCFDFDRKSPVFGAVKCRNKINGTFGTWTGPSIAIDMAPHKIASEIKRFGKELIVNNLTKEIPDFLPGRDSLL